VRITVKVDLGSRERSLAGMWVKRGEMLGFSPYFDDQVVLSPIDGTIEGIQCDSEEQAARITIRSQDAQYLPAHAR
jgi:hypothetical protein